MKTILLLLIYFTMTCSHAKTLHIGTTDSFPPFSSAADIQGNLFGFDIELMEAICKKIKAKCEFVITPYNDLFPAIKEGKIDLAVSGIIISPEMQNQYLFSLPYLKSYGRFVTLQSSKIDSFKDILSKKVGTRKGTPFKEIALHIFQDKIKVKEYPVLFELLAALKNKSVDVILINDEAAEFWYANNSKLYKLIDNKLVVGNGYVIMGKKGQNKLMALVNQSLQKLIDDGNYLKIYKRHFK